MLMEEKQAKYRHVRTATERFTDWFEDINQHEIVAFISMMQQVKGYLRAMEKLPEEKAKQFIDQVQQDFLNFYQKNQQQIAKSFYLHWLSELIWAKLSQMTDKSQVEWIELRHDLLHHSIYQAGDMVGFGELECLACHEISVIYHLTKIDSCLHCGESYFIRRGLSP